MDEVEVKHANLLELLLCNCEGKLFCPSYPQPLGENRMRVSNSCQSECCKTQMSTGLARQTADPETTTREEEDFKNNSHREFSTSHLFPEMAM